MQNRYAKLVIQALVFASVLTGMSLSRAAEIKLIAANAVKASVLEIIANFEKSSGHKVVAVWSGTDAIAKRVDSGEVFDVVVIAAQNVDKLAQEGKVIAGSKTDFAKSGVGVAVRSGLPRPDVSSSEAVKRAVLGAGSVAYSSGPSGYYLVELFKKLGIFDQIKDKIRQPPSGAQVGELVARGEADLGFQQISELINVKGIDYLGPLPPEIQNITVYSAGLLTASPAPDAAKAFIRLLAAPESAAPIKKIGMDPA